MNKQQKLSPKFWVVHDTLGSGVIIETAHYCKTDSIELFLSNHTYEILGWKTDDEVDEWWEGQSRYKCGLIEIKLVDLQK